LGNHLNPKLRNGRKRSRWKSRRATWSKTPQRYFTYFTLRCHCREPGASQRSGLEGLGYLNSALERPSMANSSPRSRSHGDPTVRDPGRPCGTDFISFHRIEMLRKQTCIWSVLPVPTTPGRYRAHREATSRQLNRFLLSTTIARVLMSRFGRRSARCQLSLHQDHLLHTKYIGMYVLK